MRVELSSINIFACYLIIKLLFIIFYKIVRSTQTANLLNSYRMRLADFDYVLPPEQIAQRPLETRDASRMLLVDRDSGAAQDRMFLELPGLLRSDELIVLNNARVIPARLLGRRV